MAQMIEVAYRSGTRLSQACKLVCMDACTLQRWKVSDVLLKSDRRPGAPPHGDPCADGRRAHSRTEGDQRVEVLPHPVCR